MATITLTPVFSSFLSQYFRTFSLVVSLHTVSTRFLKNEPITRMSQRHLPMKTRQTNSEAKHQTTYSIRTRICKSTGKSIPGRMSFELFRRCVAPRGSLLREGDKGLKLFRSHLSDFLYSLGRVFQFYSSA